MCTGQKIRVMLNDAYNNSNSFELCRAVGNKLQSRLRNMSFKNSIRNSRFKRREGGGEKRGNIIGILVFQILLRIYISESSRMREIPVVNIYDESSILCMWSMLEVCNKEETFLPVHGWEWPLGACFGPVRLGFARHVYVCNDNKTHTHTDTDKSLISHLCTTVSSNYINHANLLARPRFNPPSPFINPHVKHSYWWRQRCHTN